MPVVAPEAKSLKRPTPMNKHQFICFQSEKFWDPQISEYQKEASHSLGLGMPNEEASSEKGQPKAKGKKQHGFGTVSANVMVKKGSNVVTKQRAVCAAPRSAGEDLGEAAACSPSPIYTSVLGKRAAGNISMKRNYQQ